MKILMIGGFASETEATEDEAFKRCQIYLALLAIKCLYLLFGAIARSFQVVRNTGVIMFCETVSAIVHWTKKANLK